MKHVGSRSTDAHQELMERDPMINDTLPQNFFSKDAQCTLCRWSKVRQTYYLFPQQWSMSQIAQLMLKESWWKGIRLSIHSNTTIFSFWRCAVRAHTLLREISLTSLLSACTTVKHVGSCSNDAHRELMERDPMINDTLPQIFFSKRCTMHTLSIEWSSSIASLLHVSTTLEHVANRSTDAQRGLMERDPTVDYTEHNFHCVISIEGLSLTSSLPTSTTVECVASRLIDAHRELTERDPTIN